MLTFLIILVRISFAAFILGNAIKFIKIARAPQNLRWELYPIPGRSGGEEGDSGPAVKKIKEFGIIIEEVFTLSSVKKGNPKLWAPSLFMHWAIYLLIAMIGVNIIGSLLNIPDYAIVANSILATIAAPAGVIGAGWILFLRTFYAPLKNYSNRGHYFFATHLYVVFLAIGVSMITTHLAPAWTDEPLFSERLYEFVRAVLGLSTYDPVAVSTNSGYSFYFAVFATAIFFLYLPVTHMTHFFAKYFTYHQIRWDDEPSASRASLRKRMEMQLGYKVGWAAPHIASDGKETWLAVATKRDGDTDNKSKE